MNTYPENYDVDVAVPFTDLNGTAVTPIEVRAALYDAEGELIIDLGSLPFTAGDTSKVVTVPAEFNVLGVGELEAGRVLRTELETNAGTLAKSFSYVVIGDKRLEVMINSFMTMETAEMMARNVPNLSGWTAATEELRYAALIEAFTRLTQISMQYPDPLDTTDYGSEVSIYRRKVVIPRSEWINQTEENFVEFPKDFRQALRRAQLIEANEILEGDEIGKRQRAGVISETVGESSIMLRAGVVDQGVSSLAFKALTGFIYFNYRIQRS